MFNPIGLILTIFNWLYFIGGFLLSLWWIYLPLILILLVKDLWIKHKRDQYIQKMDWVLLEIKPPREIQKTPRAMEQFFAGLHGTQSTPNWKEMNIDGETQKWFSLEMVSLGGEIHFFIRTVATFQNLVEAQIYAQYPEAEISQVNDYVQLLPSDLPNENYDLWGTEFVLIKEDAYPIRTYSDFEKGIIMEEQRIDPIASLLEVMGKIGQGEKILIQTLVRPVLNDWKKAGEELRDKLVGRKQEKKQGAISKEAAAWKGAGQEAMHQMLTGKITEAGASKETKESETPFLWKSTKAEQEVIYAIEQNIAKIGFDVIIRFIYLARTDVFKKANAAAVIGCFRQFNTQDLNGFQPNKKITTVIDYKIQAKRVRESHRKKRVLDDYKKRDFVQYSEAIPYLKPLFFERLPILNWFSIRSKPFVFNIEELATIYHFPGLMVKAPLVPKVEAKKGEPPTGLPIH